MSLGHPARRLWRSVVGVLSAVLTTASLARAQAVNLPPVAPISILSFAQRDFVSATGYNADDRVIVKVIHPDGTIRSTDPAAPLAPQDDPNALPGAPFAGIIDVNHPGAYCWNGVTPDIRPGDVVEIDIVGGPRAGRADAISVDNLFIGKLVEISADAIELRGTALDAAGGPIAINGLGVRIITLGSAFDASGSRLLRARALAPGAFAAPGEGVITADPAVVGGFIATFSGLSPADMLRAISAIRRVDNILAGGLSGSVFETGPGIGAGPAVSCNAPLELLGPPPGAEVVPPSRPTDLATTISNFSNVTLSWTPSTDNVGVTSYGIYRNGVAIAIVQNPDGSAPAPAVYVDANVPPGTYLYTVDAADEVGNRSPQSIAAQAVTLARPAAAVAAHEPPIDGVSIIAFPSRDFVSSTGWRASDQLNVELIRDGRVISTANGLIPEGDAFALQFDGIVDVNHPGAACWAGTTPEMRAGDLIRYTAYGPDGNIRVINQTHVAGVSCQRVVVAQNDDPATLVNEGVVEIHGTAIGPDGQPIPIEQLEQRMITNSSLFDLNGRRSLRTGGGNDGLIAYDVIDPIKNPIGYAWTATYLNLNGDDVARLVGGVSTTSGRRFLQADTRIHWLGTNPGTLAEATIYENSDLNPPGPAAPGCTALLEGADTSAPTAPGNLTGGRIGLSAFQLTWSPSTDDWSVWHYRIFRDGVAIGAAPGTSNTYVDNGVPPGLHQYTVKAYDRATPLAAGPTLEFRIANAFGQPWGSASLASNAVSTNQPDVTAPSMPGDFQAIAGPNLVGLSWAPSTDDVAVTSYRLYRDGAALQDLAFPAVAHIDSLLATGTYTYQLDAADAAGNRSAKTAPVTVIVQARADLVPPSVPTGLVASISPDIHGRDVLLTWNASIDPANGGVASRVVGYSIYRDGVRIASVAAPTLTYTDVLVAVGTHRYQVDAYDSPFNHSNTSAPVTAVVANSPPARGHLINVFWARDYVGGVGYPVSGNPYHVEVIRPGATFVSDTISVRADDPTGAIDVNHPGGTCWLGITPDIVPGDVVRIVDARGIADQTYVANQTAGRPIATGPNSFVVHGTALTPLGTPMPIGQVGHLIVADNGSGLFDFGGARTLRSGAAGVDGVLTYDAPGSPNWTATYSGISTTDMFRVMGGVDPAGKVYVPGESRGAWYGRVPAALNEVDFHEVGPLVPGGPVGGLCPAPLQIPVPAATLLPALLTFPATAGTSGAQSVELRNVGGATMTVRNVYVSGLHPTDYTITAGAGPRTLAPGARLTISVVFAPKALGTRRAFVSVDCNAANTTDLSIPMTGVGIAAQAPPAAGTPVAAFVGGTQLTVAAGGAIANSLAPVRISWAPAVSPLVTGYQLQVSVNSAAWVDADNQPGAATSIVLGVPMGTAAAPKTYQYRVRALNISVPGPWTIGSRFGFTMLDNQNTSVTYSGNWALVADAGAYGGSVRSSSLVKTATTLLGKTAFRIAGSIAWVATMGPDRGLVSVSVDKGAPITVDLYSPVRKQAAIPFAVNVGSGVAHTITVNVLGTRNAASSGTRVESDLFIVLDGAAGVTPAELQQADDTEFDSTPKALAFAPISPNPSHGEAILSFALPRDGHLEMGIVDIAGRQVRSLHTGTMNAGSHHLVWDGRTSSGQASAPGIYFAVMRFEDRVLTKRIVRIP